MRLLSFQIHQVTLWRMSETDEKPQRKRFMIGRDKLATQRPKPGKYRHYKGQYYEVYETDLHTESLQAYVVYRALYGQGNLWVRPRSMFLESVEVDGKKVPRFTLVEEYPSTFPATAPES